MKDILFSGSATALITPFTEDGGDVDLGFFEKLLEKQLQCGTDALVIAGTTGEAPVLTAKEKQKLFARAVSVVENRIPVIAGTGSNDTQTALKNANEAEKEGVDGLLVVTPFYNKCTAEGLIKHFYYIADRVSAPIVVYNVPSRTGVNIRPETYAALSEHKRIVGIKEANGDLSATARTVALCGENAAVYSGNDDQTVAMMAIGAKGVISVASNLIPREIHEMTRMALENDLLGASALQRRYLELMRLLFSEVNPIPVKAAAEAIFNKTQPLRLPMTRMTESSRARLLDELKELELL